jgi:peptidoglycan hydrolase-like protein with peptidoglycan-binding domain
VTAERLSIAPGMRSTLTALAAASVLALVPPSAAEALKPKPHVASLQVALRALHHYSGGIDGLRGPKTRSATRRFQRRRHLTVDGIAGPQTRRALGRRGRPKLGSRVMHRGQHGWDVAALQFMLRRRGHSPGSVDGGFGSGTHAAVRRFQSARGLAVDGVVGSQTLRSLRHRGRRQVASGTPSGPVRFLRPVPGAMGDGFGYPGGRRHDGIDFPQDYGTSVGAAGVGRVEFAGWNSGGYGNLIVIQHRLGFQTWYAHLAGFSVSRGASVAGGVRIGTVGSTGRSTGPHLHWEVRRNGVPVNPVPYMLPQTSLGKLVFRPEADSHCLDRHKPDEKAGVAMPPRRQSPATAVLAPC